MASSSSSSSPPKSPVADTDTSAKRRTRSSLSRARQPGGNTNFHTHHSTTTTTRTIIDLDGLALDQVEWICHAILMQPHSVDDASTKTLRDFTRLDALLPSVAPIRYDSPLNVRLSVIAIWYEFIVAITKSKLFRLNNGDDDVAGGSTSQSGSPSRTRTMVSWSSSMASVQDKLITLHKSFFSNTEFDESYKKVLDLLRVYKSLEDLYDGLNDDGENGGGLSDEDVRRMIESSLDEWLAIFERHDEIPRNLMQLSSIGLRRGKSSSSSKELLPSMLQEEIVNNIINDEQPNTGSDALNSLSKSELHSQLRSLLLNWSEHEISGGLPELVLLGYRGVFASLSSSSNAAGGRGANTTSTAKSNERIVTQGNITSPSTGATNRPHDNVETPRNKSNLRYPGTTFAGYKVITRKDNEKKQKRRDEGHYSDDSFDFDSDAEPPKKKPPPVVNAAKTSAQKNRFRTATAKKIKSISKDDDLQSVKDDDDDDSSSSNDDDFDLPETQQREKSNDPKTNSDDDAFDFTGRQGQGLEMNDDDDDDEGDNERRTLSRGRKSGQKSTPQSTSSSRKNESFAKRKTYRDGDDDDSWMEGFSPSASASSPSGRKKKRHKWTAEEDAALIKGLQMFGGDTNKWSLIKSRFSVELRRRTNVQLKDRIRTLKNNGKL